MTKVRKAVIPAAGLGTRFLPATKAQPKEMLPILDKPAIQYVVEEAVGAGITDIIIITGRGKHAIVDHFDRSFELEHFLEAKGKFDELKQVREISDMATLHYIRQRDPLGLGHAIQAAEEHVGDEPFAVLLGDDLITESTPLLREMLVAHERYGRSVIAAMEVEPGRHLAVRVHRARGRRGRASGPRAVDRREARPRRRAVEPRRDRSLRPHARDLRLRSGAPEPGVGGELQLTDAINVLAQEQAVYAYVFEGGRFDVGNKLDYVKATIELAIEREDIGQEIRAWLGDLVERKRLL